MARGRDRTRPAAPARRSLRTMAQPRDFCFGMTPSLLRRLHHLNVPGVGPCVPAGWWNGETKLGLPVATVLTTLAVVPLLPIASGDRAGRREGADPLSPKA